MYKAVFGLEHDIRVSDPETDHKIVQVFVYSYDTSLWYLQAPLSPDGMCTVILGDYNHFVGRYRVVAVSLSGQPVQRKCRLVLPDGERSPEHKYLRIGW